MTAKNGHVQTLDAVVRRLKYLHDTQLIPWRKIAQRPEYEGIPHGTLWSIAHGREPADNEQRRVLGLPPRTVPVPPCAECGKVHEVKATCTDKLEQARKTEDYVVAFHLRDPDTAAALRRIFDAHGKRRRVARALVTGKLIIAERGER